MHGEGFRPTRTSPIQDQAEGADDVRVRVRRHRLVRRDERLERDHVSRGRAAQRTDQHLRSKPGPARAVLGQDRPGRPRHEGDVAARNGHGWSTADSTRTGRRRGRFSVSTTATRVGKMVLRLKVASPRRGIGGAVSTWVTVTSRRVRSRSHRTPATHGGDGDADDPSARRPRSAPRTTSPTSGSLARLAASPCRRLAAQPDCNRPAPSSSASRTTSSSAAASVDGPPGPSTLACPERSAGTPPVEPVETDRSPTWVSTSCGRVIALCLVRLARLSHLNARLPSTSGWRPGHRGHADRRGGLRSRGSLNYREGTT